MGDIVDVLDSKRKPITKSDRISGPYPYYGATGELDRVAEYLFDEPLVLLGEDGAKWGTGDDSAYMISGKTWVNNHAHVLRPDRSTVLDVYLTAFLNAIDINGYITGGVVPKLNQESMKKIVIKLPSIDDQKRIVAKLEAEQEIIDANKRLIDLMQDKINQVMNRIYKCDA